MDAKGVGVGCGGAPGLVDIIAVEDVVGIRVGMGGMGPPAGRLPYRLRMKMTSAKISPRSRRLVVAEASATCANERGCNKLANVPRIIARNGGIETQSAAS